MCLTYLVYPELLPAEKVIKKILQTTWADVEENVCSFVNLRRRRGRGGEERERGEDEGEGRREGG